VAQVGKILVWGKLTDSGDELLKKESFLDDLPRFYTKTNILGGDSEIMVKVSVFIC
jgi:hypothetical protein